MTTFVRLMILGVLAVLLSGCPVSMEPTDEKLLLRNTSDTKLIVLLNLSYPDSSLSHAMIDRYIEPQSQGYIGNTLPLDRANGLTVIVYDYGYYESRWCEHCGTPDEYLDESEMLARYVHTREQLDSLGWVLTYRQ